MLIWRVSVAAVRGLNGFGLGRGAGGQQLYITSRLNREITVNNGLQRDAP